MSFAILIILLPLGLAASLIFRGLRGFRVGTHPVCRRCGYDLFGQPVGTVICGECGSSLTVPNSVYIGHHQRRPSLIVAGIVILVPVLFVAGVMVWGQINDIHWMSYAPTRFVIWRAESANPATRSPALAELNARLTAGKLSTAELEKIADAGLAYQADLTKPWDTGWGDLLEAIQSRGKLSDDRWKRYLTQASQGAFGLRLRKQVRHGDGLPWQIERIANRAGTKMKLQISFESSPLEWLSPHGPVPKTQLPIACQTSLYGSGGASLAKLQPAQFPEPLPDGVQQVHVHGTVKVGFRGNTWRINPMVSSEHRSAGHIHIAAGKYADYHRSAGSVAHRASAEVAQRGSCILLAAIARVECHGHATLSADHDRCKCTGSNQWARGSHRWFRISRPATRLDAQRHGYGAAVARGQPGYC